MGAEPPRGLNSRVAMAAASEKAHPDVFNVLLQVLDDGRAVQAKPSGHIAFEARYADPHVCRVAELLQPYGDQADDGAHNDDARRCRKKIFPHLLLLPKRFGGYTMRTMAPS